MPYFKEAFHGLSLNQVKSSGSVLLTLSRHVAIAIAFAWIIINGNSKLFGYH